MQRTRHILIIILTVVLIVSGVPVFAPEDASRDNRVDLEDAVLFVRDFARAAHEPAAFTGSVEKVVSTMNVVAGLKTVICQDREKTSAKQISSECCFVSSYCLLVSMGNGFQVYGKPFFYKSVTTLPDHRYG